MPRKPKSPPPEPQLGLEELFGGGPDAPGQVAREAPDREAAGREAAGREAAGRKVARKAPGAPGAPEAPDERVLTVAEVVSQASRALEARFQGVWVEGEISNLRRISSGHLFFSLKDDRAQLPCVLFRADAARLRFRMEDGLAVRCRGTLRIYEAQGKLQLYVDRVEPVGLGALMLAYEQLKRKLAAEGLFDEQRKRPLPVFPRRVGVVTSSTGAALRDIMDVIGRRFAVPILVSPTPVQGQDAPPQIVAALGRLCRVPGVDVIIVGRGGGSMEDLWCWNDEAVVRAVAACPIPTVSAVGHEIDHTLCDLAADLRAPTPSAAAERVVPDRHDVGRHLSQVRSRLGAVVRGRLVDQQLVLSRLRHGLGDPRPRLLDARASLEGLRTRQERTMGEALAWRRQALGAARERVARGHPRARLAEQRALLRERGRALGEAARALLRGRRVAVDRVGVRLGQEGRALVEPWRRRFAVQMARLGELSPLGVLARGYAVAVGKTGRAIRSFREAEKGDALRLRLWEGELGCTVTEQRPPEGEGGSRPHGDPVGRGRARSGGKSLK